MAKYIGNIPSVGEFKKLDSLTSTFNGSLTQFNLEYGSTSVSVGDASQLIVSLNGIIQEPLTAYTLAVGGSAIVFSSAPASTDTCHIILLGGVGGTSTVSDGAVTAAKLDAGLKDYLEETYSANGSQTTYNLTRAPIGTNDLMITIDGIVQPSTAYSVAGTTLTISPALPNGTDVRVVHMGVRAGFVVPSSSSITAAMFQDFTTDVKFNDNAKALFGTGDDLQIYHDAGGFNQIVALNDHPIQIKTASENMIKAIPNSGVELYHNNSLKLAITSTGIDVTGTVTTDGLTVDASGEAILSLNGYTASQNTEVQLVSIREDTSTSKSILDIKTNNGTSLVKRARFDWDGDISFYDDTGTTAKFFWDASTERLGIGTSAPNTTLDITTASNTNGFVLDIIGTAPNYMFDVRDDGASKFRIDASGNLLVGKTTTSFGTQGVALRNNRIQSTNDGGSPLELNRLTSDGDIALFQKDGSTVGSIGASGGDLIIGTGDTGVHFHDGVDSIIPWSVTAASYRNNAIDLGTASYSYRDLYLLGGIKFDTNGEFLDGYERGTFTPAISGLTFTSAVGTYVKIGRVCHISIVLEGSNNSTSGDIYVTGLPFISLSNNYGANSVPFMEVANISLGSGYTNMYGRVQASDTRIQILQSAGTAHAAMNAGGGLSSGAVLRTSFTYQTNA